MRFHRWFLFNLESLFQRATWIALAIYIVGVAIAESDVAEVSGETCRHSAAIVVGEYARS